jgi:hypothetical protein
VFSGIGATISESYPNDVRATGYGVSYNAGRVIGSFFPLSVGWLSGDGTSLPLAIAMVAGVGYAMVILSAALLPETTGIELGDTAGEGATVHDEGGQQAPAGRLA